MISISFVLYFTNQNHSCKLTQLIKFIFVAGAMFLFMADYKNNEEKIVKLFVLHSESVFSQTLYIKWYKMLKPQNLFSFAGDSPFCLPPGLTKVRLSQ